MLFRKLHSWWQKPKQQPFIAMIIIVVLFALIASIFAAYKFGWGWTGFDGYNKVSTRHTISGPLSGTVTRTEEYQPGKALWDWLQLLGVLAIPVVVGFGAVWFSYRQNRTTSRIAEDRQREDTLQAYFDKISELLFKEHLGDLALRGGVVPGYEEARKIARARTLTVLQRLDGDRKGSMLRFLHESGLIDRDKPIIQMNGTDLSGANLSGASLSGVNLSEANLSGADLSDANLSKIRRWPTMSTTQWQILQNADRRGLREQALYRMIWNPLSVFWGPITKLIFKNGTNLSGANLSEANLSGADLSDANLERANLKEADLSGTNLTMTHLKEANLTEATMSRAKQTINIICIKFPLQEWWTGYPKWADLEKGPPLSFKRLSTTEAKNLLTKAKNRLEKSDGNKTSLTVVNLKTVNFLNVIRLEAVAADLQEADLTGADLTDADLSGTNLRKAIITREQLGKAKLLKGTTMPDGTKQPW
jgi:uncharacterized protein YjbI with pentapeptide repeats